MDAARPQPWNLAPAGRLAAVTGVLTDIDDTLTRDGAIELPALAALQRLAAAGVPVIAITGRPAGWSEAFALAWPVAAIVAENGGVLLRRDHGRLQVDFTQDAAHRADNARRLQACAQDVLARVPGATLARDSAGRLTDIAIDHGEFAHLPPAAIDAVVAVMHAHGLTATVSSIHVNGWLGAHSKWTAAPWAVREALGQDFNAARWLYVGDSANDELMFEHMPLSVAVANILAVLPRLTHKPAWITAAERGLGFAAVVERLLAARAQPRSPPS